MVLSLTGTQARPRPEPPGGAIVPRWCLAGAPCVDGARAAEGAQNSRVWTQLALIEIQPGPAQIGGSLRGCDEDIQRLGRAGLFPSPADALVCGRGLGADA